MLIILTQGNLAISKKRKKAKKSQMELPRDVVQQLLSGRARDTSEDGLGALNEHGDYSAWDGAGDSEVLRERLTALPLLVRMEKIMLGLAERCKHVENSDSYDPHKEALLIKTNLDLLGNYRALLGLVLPPLRPVQVSNVSKTDNMMEIVIKDDGSKTGSNGSNGSGGKFVMDLSDFEMG